MSDVKLYQPYNKQKEVHRVLEDRTVKFVTCVAGRQSGKTMMAINAAMMAGLKNKNKIVYWVSPTTNQANKVYKQIINEYAGSPFIKRYKGSAGDTEIELFNGTTILFRGAAQGNALRGESSVFFMVIDEAAMIDEEFVNEVLLPMGNTVEEFKVLYTTTPKGKNWVYKNYLKGMNNTKRFKSFHFTSKDNPYADKEYIELVKANIPELQFKQEYLAEFVDNASVFNEVGDVATLTPLGAPLQNDKYFMGVDVALRDDYTVITVLNQKREMVYMDRWNDSNAPAVTKRIKEAIEKWKPVKTFIEQNGLGMAICDELKITHKINNIVNWITTNKSKNEIVNNLINVIEKRDIKLLNDKMLIAEMEAFEMKVSPQGVTTFGGPSGFNDDTCMALCIANECLNKNRYTGGITFV